MLSLLKLKPDCPKHRAKQQECSLEINQDASDQVQESNRRRRGVLGRMSSKKKGTTPPPTRSTQPRQLGCYLM